MWDIMETARAVQAGADDMDFTLFNHKGHKVFTKNTQSFI